MFVLRKRKMMVHKIYKITNKINNKIYVGQTAKSIKHRWKRHCWNCSCKNMVISRAIKKYGKENFKIKEIDRCYSQEEADDLEKYYANALNAFSPNGYNLKAGNGYRSMSDETRLKLSIANTGKTRTKETLDKLSKSHLGKTLTKKTRKKISAKNKGRKPSNLTTQRSSELSSSEFDIIMPNSEIVHVNGLIKFCKENGHTPSKLSELINGKRKQYKGIRLYSKYLSKRIIGGCKHKYGSRKYFKESDQMKFTKTCRLCGIVKTGLSMNKDTKQIKNTNKSYKK